MERSSRSFIDPGKTTRTHDGYGRTVANCGPTAAFSDVHAPQRTTQVALSALQVPLSSRLSLFSQASLRVRSFLRFSSDACCWLEPHRCPLRRHHSAPRPAPKRPACFDTSHRSETYRLVLPFAFALRRGLLCNGRLDRLVEKVVAIVTVTIVTQVQAVESIPGVFNVARTGFRRLLEPSFRQRVCDGAFVGVRTIARLRLLAIV
jgi:hypothetical protein